MYIYEKIIRDYFESWLTKDISVLSSIFSIDALYIESWGPRYQNLDQITNWFQEWNEDSTVLQWDIKQFIHQSNVVVCEWYFKCDYKSEVTGFDGVSIVSFDSDNKIYLLKEFQAKSAT